MKSFVFLMRGHYTSLFHHNDESTFVFLVCLCLYQRVKTVVQLAMMEQPASHAAMAVHQCQ